MPVRPGTEPFAHDGADDVGVLLCHGFTGSPSSMRPWGEHLAAHGFSVRGPRLPGHGTSWQEMNRTRWQDWYGCVEASLDELRGRCRLVFVCGLSMGGTLTLRLAEQRGADIAGIVLVNPSVITLRKEAKLLPVLSRVIGSVPGIGGDVAKPGAGELAYGRTPLRAALSLSRLWPLVRADLDKITVPMLLLHSTVDHVVEPVNAKLVWDGVRSTDRREVVLERSFHVATLDYDAPVIFEESVRFIDRIAGERIGDAVGASNAINGAGGADVASVDAGTQVS
ncbi:MAG: alpha/beta fold hydrolase [Sciscionella sp.]|nr:alpha/beta fold hydrolase [Sciscionella sp.]